MDTRTDRGDFYPGGETGGSAPAPQQSDKVDRVNLGEIGEDYTLKVVKQKVNQIVRVIAPAAKTFALMLYACCHLAMAATAPLEEIPNTSPVVTNEEDAVALATLATATNALQASTSAAMSELRSDINNASNNLATAIGEAIASESNRVEATYAKRSEIPAAPDLSPYALKSELPADYLTEGDITNFATRAWISGQGYATEAGMNARIDAQNLALGAATNAQNAAIAASSNALAGAHAADMAKVGAATNAILTAMASGTNRLWQTARSESNRLDRTAAEIRDEIAALELTGGMTRLWTSDAKKYQDATGVVWQVSVATSAWTVVHSGPGAESGEDLGWGGPAWWPDGESSEYWYGRGWYVWNTSMTPELMNEDELASEIIARWAVWTNEVELAVTSRCTRSVQWLTNEVNRVAYTNELEAAMNAVSEGVMEWVTETLGSWMEMGTVRFAYELRSDEQDVSNVSAADVWQIARNAREYTDAATNGLPEEIARKQDALPYPTNAIPYAAISGAPSGGGQEWREEWGSVSMRDSVIFVTNGIYVLTFDGAEATDPVMAYTGGWPDGAAMFVRGTDVSGPYQVANNIRLVGYGTWPTNDFQSVWWRRGTNIFVNILVEE